MPYIPEVNRRNLQNGARSPKNAGELAFVIYDDALRYIGPNLTFLKCATVMGALICVALELYRRVIAPYEDRKREENGDV